MRFNTENLNDKSEKSTTITSKKQKRIAVEVNTEDFNISLESFSKKFQNLENEFKILLEEKANVLFSAIPELEKFVIIQYTPYFMDGDACEFSINDISFFAEKDDNESEEDEDNEDEEWDCDFQSTPTGEELKTYLRNFIINNSIFMQSAYGDHVKIRFTKDCVTIEDYDHE